MLSVLPVDGEKRFRVGLITPAGWAGRWRGIAVRRQLREIVRRNQHALKGGIWFVVIARRSAAQTDSAALEAEWLRLAQRTGIL
jgi:ribonuclease P protein component